MGRRQFRHGYVLSGWLVVIALSGAAQVMGSGDEAGPELPTGFDPAEIERLDDHRVRVGGIVVDGQAGEIHVPAAVNMEKGLVELIACGPEGKRHESVLVAHIRPLHLQVALLLLGLEAGTPVENVGDSIPPTGDLVKIQFEWSDGDANDRFPVERLVRRADLGREMPPQPWVFAGSRIEGGSFVADIEQSLITTYRDPASIIDNGEPGGIDDELFEVNSDAIRPLGETGILVLSAYSEP